MPIALPQTSAYRWFLMLGILAPLLRQGIIFTLSALSPGYSSLFDFLSQLGATGTPYQDFMNFSGLLLVGFLMVLSSFGLYRLLYQHTGGKLVSYLIALSGIGFILIGIFPCPTGDCQPDTDDVNMKIHMLAGTVALGCQVWAPFAFGLLGISNPTFGWNRMFSLMLGTLGVLAYIYLIFQHQQMPYPGLIQRIAQIIGDLWLFLICLIGFSTRR